MKTDLRDISTSDLAFMTGHKLTNIEQTFVSAMLGHVWFAKLDGSPFQKLSTIRQHLEREYLKLEKKQGTPYPNRENIYMHHLPQDSLE